MERSKLERLGDSQLKKYLNYVLSVYEESITDIEDFYYEMTQDTQKYKKIAGPFGGNLNRLDMEYIFMCFVLNGNDFSEDVLFTGRCEAIAEVWVIGVVVHRIIHFFLFGFRAMPR